MQRALIVALAGIALLVTAFVAPVHASPSQVDGCDDDYSDVNIVTITPSEPLPGDTVTITGEGFEPGVGVDIELDTVPSSGSPIDLGTVVAGENDLPGAGTFEIEVTLPSDLVDQNYIITATSEVCADDRGSVEFTVGTPPPPPPTTPSPTTPTGTTGGSDGGSLPRTGGSQTITLTQMAIGLIAMGGVFLMTGGRRRALPRSSHSSRSD